MAAQNFGEQQTIADAFHKNGLLPARVETNQAQLWDFSAGQVKEAKAAGG